MENLKTITDEITEVWVKPEIKISQIKEETLGNGGGGFDFGSEVSA